MALPYNGGARFPGPVGISAGDMNWQIPGILGFKQVAGPAQSSTKSIKSVPMPYPWNNSNSKRVGPVLWPLSKDKISYTDIKQGGLPNCPVGAVLGALANTSAGRKYLDSFITEFTGITIKTVLTDDIIADVDKTNTDKDDVPQVRELISHRYFTVKLWSGEIPDTLYIEYSDGADTSPVFMSSPNGVLWPAIIEKACAYHFSSSYKELSDYSKHNANEHWKLIVGKDPGGFEVKDSTDLDNIRDAAHNAKDIPTLCASKVKIPNPQLSPWHAYTLVGLNGKNIDLYDPHGFPKSVTAEEFRDNFQTILFGTP